MTPDPQAFAKSVLALLASIQADVYQNQLLLVELLARETGKKASDIQEQWKVESETLRRRRYAEAIRAAGLEDDLDSPESDNPSRL